MSVPDKIELTATAERFNALALTQALATITLTDSEGNSEEFDVSYHLTGIGIVVTGGGERYSISLTDAVKTVAETIMDSKS